MKKQHYLQQAQGQKVELKYESVEVEGECTLQQISPIKFLPWRYALFLISNLCIMIPWFMKYWYPRYQRVFYFAYCNLEEATHFSVLNYDGQTSIVTKQRKVFMIDEEKSCPYTCFVNRYMTYVIDKQVVRVSMYDFRERLARITQLKERQTGLSEAQAHQLKNTYGPGTMIVNRPRLINLILQQILRPLSICIFTSISFWVFYIKYFYYAGIVFFFSLVGIAINLYQLMQQYEKIFKMAYYEHPVSVLRNGKAQKISSLDVVPGDIVFIKEAIKVPFEGILLQGSALINECALTGQSAPVVKKADSFEKLANNSLSIDKSSFIYEGTTIIQVNNEKKISKFQQFREAYGLPVCVIRTNFVTTKGQLVRIILFPKQQENIFQIQSYKFIAVVGAIFVVIFIAVSLLIYRQATTSDIVVSFVVLATLAVTPALPISMTFGIIYAIERLEKKKIFCIVQNKVIDGGLTDLCCFDKTGTLTQEGMDFHALIPFDGRQLMAPIFNNQTSIDQMLCQSKKYPYINDALTNMAANNTIVKIQANGELVGDPMEVKSFQFGSFSLNQSHPNPEVIFAFESERGHRGIILRRFEFDSDLQRMSVVCQSTHNKKWKVYSKGSPQILLAIMKKDSVPNDFQVVLKKYASCGFRILAIASRQITEEEVKRITRSEAEKQLQFNGFYVFQNKLKSETKGAISLLKNAQIGCVMITGDNTLTGSNISYKCGISSQEKEMIICDFDNGAFQEQSFQFRRDSSILCHSKKISESMNEKSQYIDSKSQSDRGLTQNLIPSSISMDQVAISSCQQNFMSKITSKANSSNCQLCVTGRAFNQLFPETFVKLTQEEIDFLRCVSVFARTKPSEKARIVMAYQHMGLRVAMCGDGANDCGALKQANIGLSLSQAEASISAPFTSQIPNITAMVELIKECRTGLATNFSLFNIIAMYCLIQFTTTVISLRYLQFSPDAQFLYWDIALNFIFILLVGYTKTVKELSPLKPRGSLFSATNLLQITVVFIIQAGAQILVIYIFQKINNDYYWTNGGWDNAVINYQAAGGLVYGLESNILFLFINNIYVATMMAFNIAKPWRQYFLTNLPLMVVIIITLLYNNALILWGDSAWADFYCNDYIPDDHTRLVILIASLGFGVVIYIVQKLILQPLSNWLIKSYPHVNWL